jgi:hypothetical protein
LESSALKNALIANKKPQVCCSKLFDFIIVTGISIWGNIFWALKKIKHGKLKKLFGRLNK